MFDYISYAIITLALLLLFMTPVGLCLLLASPFWTVGMDVVSYFVEHHYPGKVVAAVLAVVAVLFVGVVRFIWVVLLLQGGPAKDDEAVSSGHRVIETTAAGKYGGQPKEAPSADDLAVVLRSSLSVNRSRIGHSHPEYPSLVGGSRSNLRLLEKDADSAVLLSNKPRMPERGDACAFQHRLMSNATLARDVCIAATAAAVDKEFRGLAVPCTCGVAHAFARSFEVNSRHCSPSGVTASSRSTGLSDGAFVASAGNVAVMMGAMDAPSVGGSCVPGAADPLGEASASVPSATAIGADAVECVVAAVSGDDAGVSPLSGAASDRGSGSAGALVASATATSGASGASLVRLLASSFGSVLGSKRCIDDDDDSGLGHEESDVQAKKRKVAPLGIAACFPQAILEDSAARASGDCAFGAAPVLSGGIIASATIVDDLMDICVPISSPPLCPTPMDVDITAAFVDPETTSAMDLDHNNFDPMVWEPSAMDISADGVFVLPPACAASTALPSAAITTAAFLTSSLSVATAATTTTPTHSVSTPTSSAATPAQTRRIARPRVPSELRRVAILNAARQYQHQAASTTHTSNAITTSSCAAFTTVANSTTTATALSAASAETAENNTATTSSSTPRLELEEFDLNPAEILDSSEYLIANQEYDEFDGFDFSSEEFDNIIKELDHELS